MDNRAERTDVEPLGAVRRTVALFNASDDTIDMIRKLLDESHNEQVMIGCHFADLKKGVIDFGDFIASHDPEVVIVDLSPPYDENWRFFVTMRDSAQMDGRGLVLTTTNKNRLDEVLGEDSYALEVVGRDKDLREIDAAIRTETGRARAGRQPPATPISTAWPGDERGARNPAE